MNDDVAARWARALVRGMIDAGVARFFVSPGSRSTPLVLAAHALAPDALTVVVDERGAAFAALGFARASGRPAAVIATSGSAPAHFYPAIIEADLAHIPMIVVSADRPIELQEAGASQTVDQVKLFGGHVRRSFEIGAPDAAAIDAAQAAGFRAVVAAVGPAAGPVHVNARFRKPLEPSSHPTIGAQDAAPTREAPSLFAGAIAPSEAATAEVAARLAEAERPCLVAGPRLGCGAALDGELDAAVRAFASAAGAAVFAEVTSGITGGVGWAAPLEAALAARVFEMPGAPDLVIEIGLVPVSAAYASFATACAGRARRIVVAPTVAQDPFGTARAFILSEAIPFLKALTARLPPRPASLSWPTPAIDAARRAASEIAEVIAARADDARLTEPDVAAAIARSQSPGSVVIVGNSLVVRDFEAFAAPALPGGVTVLHQRGAAGIDGLVAGAFGARLALPPERPVTLVLGDVSALHDVGSFAALPGIASCGPLAVVVVNNDGGRIFDDLPVHGVLGEGELFDRLYRTKPPADFTAGVAKAFGLRQGEAATTRDLGGAIEEALRTSGPTIVEAVADPEESRAARRALRDRPRKRADRPAYVLLHGMLGAPSMFDAFVWELARVGIDRADIIAPRLGGHGGARADRSATSFDEAVRDLAKELPDRPLVPIGYSLGARVALALATSGLVKVERVVAVGAHLGLEDGPDREQRRAWERSMAKLAREKGMAALVDAWEALPVFASQATLPERVRSAQRRDRSAHDPEGIAWAFETLGTGSMPPLHAALAALSVPVDFVAGAADEKFSQIAEAAARLVPHGRATIVPGAGHNVVLEAPAALADVVASAHPSITAARSPNPRTPVSASFSVRGVP